MKRNTVESQVEKHKRQRKVECALVRGQANQMELAARYGVSQATINRDVYEIRERWRKEATQGKLKERRFKRIRQLEFVYAQAIESYERSRQDEEEILTQHKPTPCNRCKATGKNGNGNSKCKACDGTGTQLVEVVTRRVKGQEGNASFLEAARKSLVDICRLEGLIVATPTIRSNRTVIMNQTKQEEEDPFKGVPSEVVLEARAAFLRLRDAREAAAKDQANGEAPRENCHQESQ